MDSALLTTIPEGKRRIAVAASHTPLSLVSRRWESFRPLVRIFNYHAVPARLASSFERQLEHLERRFRFAPADELEQVLRDGPGDRSVAFFSFDDGLANHYDHAAPLLERRGVTGFFSIPAAFPEEGPAWFRRHVYPVLTELHAEPEDVTAMTWLQIEDLAARGHRICSHGFDHVVLDATADRALLEREIVESRALLETHLTGAAVTGFCWPGRSDRHAVSASALIEETYTYSFGTQVRPLRGGSNHHLPRINLEASWSTELVDLQLSGLLDGLYAAKRMIGR
jgi:peptidoglycan/xylan/chitin deacetylase (PgdA/CDA1 family)